MSAHAALNEEYVVAAGSLEHREQIVALWRKCWRDDSDGISKFDWFHAGCPWGPSFIQLLRYRPSDQIVGVAALGQRRMLWQGREIRAGVFGDLAVTPDHRSFAPARMLLRSLIERSSESLDLMYGMPNPKAAALFRRLARTRVGDITRYACILRHRRYLAPHLPSALAYAVGAALDAAQHGWRRLRQTTGPALESRWTEKADPEFDSLWERSDHGTDLVQVHDTAMARWRFDEYPVVRTRYLLLSDPETHTLLAWFACHAQQATLHVDDFWSHDAAEGIQTRYIAALLAAAEAEGHATASLAFAGHVRKTRGWTRAGFVKRETRPIFGFCSDGSEVPRDIHLTAGDEDQ